MPSETDLRRWEKWDDLRARKAAAKTDVELADLEVEENLLREHGRLEMLLEEIHQPKQWFWMSFADPDKEPGTQFLGVCIVQGGGIAEATQTAWDLGINPGGEIQAHPIPEEHVPDEKYRLRLLSRDELEEAGLA